MEDIQYFEGGKVAVFKGQRFVRDDKSGYYRNSKSHKRLHRAVYEYHHGKIPVGYDVHHIDFDKANNAVSNLMLLTWIEHRRVHGECISEEQRELMRKNMVINAMPAAAEWHRSDAGREWHRRHYQQTKDRFMQKRQMTCVCCGKEYLGYANAKFCSDRCRRIWRRKSRVGNE